MVVVVVEVLAGVYLKAQDWRCTAPLPCLPRPV